MQGLCRKAVGICKTVWRDKGWGGDFSGELFVDVHLLCQKQEWDVFVQPESRHTAQMGGSSLPGFHIPSLFPNGSPALWYSDMVMDFFLLIMLIIQLEAPPRWDSHTNTCNQV